MSILHKIKAWLYDNPLTDDPNDFVARVSSERSLSVNDICESAVSRGGADTSAQTMEHNVKLFLKEMAYLLCDGYSVNTGYFTASMLIKGVFNSPAETFNVDKHTLSFQFNQGDTLRSELASVGVDIMGVAESGTTIAQVTDVKSGSVNDMLTPNRNLKVKGSKIKLVGDNTSIGVYFINQASGASIKVDSADVVTNNPSELIIVIPGLAAGTYKLQVVTQFSGSSTPLKEPRSSTFDKVLTVK